MPDQSASWLAKASEIFQIARSSVPSLTRWDRQSAWTKSYKSLVMSGPWLSASSVRRLGTVQKLGGLRCLRPAQPRTGCWPEQLAEGETECSVVDGAADLQQQVGAAPGPAHLL